jgi:hypothetical protein
VTRLSPLVALVLVALTGAGCGSDDTAHTSATATATPKQASAREKAVRFAECIRAHGVADFPDPNAKNEFEYGVSVTPAVWKRATTACKDLQPPGTLSGKRTHKEQSDALKFAQCMRDNGVKDFPDPANGDPLVDTTKIRSLGDGDPRTDPVFAPAMDKCRVALEAALRDAK